MRYLWMFCVCSFKMSDVLIVKIGHFDERRKTRKNWRRRYFGRFWIVLLDWEKKKNIREFSSTIFFSIVRCEEEEEEGEGEWKRVQKAEGNTSNNNNSRDDICSEVEWRKMRRYAHVVCLTDFGMNEKCSTYYERGFPLGIDGFLTVKRNIRRHIRHASVIINISISMEA